MTKKQEEIEEMRWEWVKVCECNGYETYSLRPLIVTRRAFVYSHGEVIWQIEEK